MRMTYFTVFMCATVMLHGAVVSAQDAADKEAQAKQLYKDGMALAQKGDCQSAVEKFRNAMTVLPNKGSLYNLATCYNKLKQYQKAMAAFKRLTKEFDAELQDEMKAEAYRQIAALKKQFAWVTIHVNQKGAEVLVNGQKQGTSPLAAALPLERQPQDLVVVLKGYKPWSKKVNLTDKQEARFDVTLTPEDGHLALSMELSGATVSVDGKMVGVTPLPTIALSPGTYRVTVSHNTIQTIERKVTITSGEQTGLVIDKGAIAQKRDVSGDDEGASVAVAKGPTSKQRMLRIGGFVTGGVGVAALIGGIVTGSMALGIDKDLAKECPKENCPTDDFSSDEQKMNNLGASSTALFAVGGVLAAAGVTLVLLSYKLDFGETQLGFAPALSPQTAGATVQVRF